jgi:hypothetical protein
MIFFKKKKAVSEKPKSAKKPAAAQPRVLTAEGWLRRHIKPKKK